VNPWSGAEGGESMERELFARRARALEPARVPPLADVLRAARVKREEHDGRERHAMGSARGRTVMAVALAAACMMATLTKLPSIGNQIGPRASIAAEMDASAGGEIVPASTQEPAAGDTCSARDERLALGIEEQQACFAPAPLYTPAPAIAPLPDVPCHASDPHPCDPNESCANETQ
jgi:hypothetical protein